MKSQSRRAESLSRRSLSREHSRALLWENLITSTLCVSSLMKFFSIFINFHGLVMTGEKSCISDNLLHLLDERSGEAPEFCLIWAVLQDRLPVQK